MNKVSMELVFNRKINMFQDREAFYIFKIHVFVWEWLKVWKFGKWSGMGAYSLYVFVELGN